MTSSPTQFEPFSDAAGFYSSQFTWKSLHYQFFFVLSPFHLNYCCTIPLLSSSDHKGLLVLLYNDVLIKRPFSNSSRTVWCYSQANCDLACDLLNESDWNSMFYNASNMNQLWSTWQKRFLEIMEICIPKKHFPQKSLALSNHCLVQ